MNNKRLILLFKSSPLENYTWIKNSIADHYQYKNIIHRQVNPLNTFLFLATKQLPILIQKIGNGPWKHPLYSLK